LKDGGHTHPEWHVGPVPKAAFPIVPVVPAASSLPVLFRIYLRYGAKVCGLPAIDREFKTIDYLVVLDVDALSRSTHKRFFG
jgi:putative hemolysin